MAVPVESRGASRAKHANRMERDPHLRCGLAQAPGAAREWYHVSKIIPYINRSTRDDGDIAVLFIRHV